jgi:hypothetical protein
MDDRAAAVAGRATARNRVRLDNRVDQHVPGRPLELGFGNPAFDQEPAAGLHAPRTGQSGLDRRDGNPRALPILSPGRWLNPDVPEHDGL